MKKDEIDEFIELLPKMQAVEIIGLARLLNVKVMTDTVARDPKKIPPRHAQDILEDLVVAFGTASRKVKRGILKFMRPAAKYNTKAKMTPLQLQSGANQEVDDNGLTAKN